MKNDGLSSIPGLSATEHVTPTEALKNVVPGLPSIAPAKRVVQQAQISPLLRTTQYNIHSKAEKGRDQDNDHEHKKDDGGDVLVPGVASVRVLDQLPSPTGQRHCPLDQQRIGQRPED